MAMSAEHSPSPLMVTSPYEWKILEWDDKPKQTHKQTRSEFYVIAFILLNFF